MSRPGTSAKVVLCGVVGLCAVAWAGDVAVAAGAAATNRAPANAREFYNLGTRKLAAGSLDEAEGLLRTAVREQKEEVQAKALYNLGHVRFAQGDAILKKEEGSAGSAAVRASMTADASNRAIQMAETALAGNDLQQMLAAYLNGRGVRRDLRSATEAVRRAMTVFGGTLLKWRRARGDFKGAAELAPDDTRAIRNVEVVDREIARLVDSLREMQRAAQASSGQDSRLGELLQLLKGRIPRQMMPPGAGGDDWEEDGEGKEEGGLTPEMLRGHEEGPSRSGSELQLMLSAEEAGQLLDAVRLDGNRRLPISEGEPSKPQDRSGRTW